MPEPELEFCSICGKRMRRGGHQVCRSCVIARNWALARFQWFPERRVGNGLNDAQRSNEAGK